MAAEPIVVAAKFTNLIIETLTNSPKRVREIYQIAQERQPQDCTDVLCPHRKKSSKSMEWQHEIQRQLSRIATNRDGLWYLKNTLPVNPSTAHTTVEEIDSTSISEIKPDIAVVPVTPTATYTGDPFLMVEAQDCPPWAQTGGLHFMDAEELDKPVNKRFVVPMNFDEFYAWKPEYVLNWVKKRLGRFSIDEEVEDWTQDLLIHLRYLPQGSKYRQPGANGRVQGCQDVIETYDPIQAYGASERRFRSHFNNILGNKFLTVQSKRQKNPVLRPGNLPIGVGSSERDSETVLGDEFVHANSDYLVSHSERIAKQHDDRLYTNQFKEFVMNTDPAVYPALEALEFTGTISEAAKHINVSDSEFTRLRNRLKQLAECFSEGTPVPKQRRQYKKRAKAAGATAI
jgi:hypothetical protein